MLHIVPILCLILFIGLVEYRLKQHLDDIDLKVKNLEKIIKNNQNSCCKADKKDECLCSE